MRALLVVLILLFSSMARADEVPAYLPNPPVQTIPPGDDEIMALAKGAVAPISGQLFSPATALRWSNWLSQYRVRLVQDVQREHDICTAEINHLEELRGVEAVRNIKVEEALSDGLKRSEQRNASLQDKINDPSFFRSMEFGLILGVTVTAVGAVAIAVAAN